MAPVLIDTTADFSPAVMPATTTSPAGQPRSLLLAPPSLAAHEDRLRAAFSAFDRATTDLQMLDRLSAGLVTLPAATYELVLVLNGGGGGASQRSEMSRAAYALLVPAMATGGLLRFQDGPPRAGDAREAILAGLVERGDGFEKLLQEETVIPLRFGKKKKTDAPPPVRGGEDNAVKFDFNFDDVDDDIIDENDLLSEEDLKRRPVIPTDCQPQKRRRPCKDCTCGLAAKFEAEDKQRRAEANAGLALRLDENDLNELDFTVEGKTGSCNNCSLGDAFRCSTCPYIGLPAFKPGEEVHILNDLVQL